jgi:hypothetical protein
VIKDVALNISGTLDTFRHLLPSSSSSGNDDGGGNLPDLPGGGNGDGDGGDNSGNGNGGNGDDNGGDGGNNGNGSDDGGSGGPLDRHRLTDRADGAVEVLPHTNTKGTPPIVINIHE